MSFPRKLSIPGRRRPWDTDSQTQPACLPFRRKKKKLKAQEINWIWTVKNHRVSDQQSQKSVAGLEGAGGGEF